MLEWPTELRRRVDLLGYRFMMKGKVTTSSRSMCPTLKGPKLKMSEFGIREVLLIEKAPA